MLVETSIGISVAINVLALEIIGLTAGGMVVPGYLAFFLDQPSRLVATFVMAILTLYLVRMLGRYMVIYGRRRFALTLLMGFLVNAGLFQVLLASGAYFEAAAWASTDLRVIGYLVPGLIANEMSKQGIVVTIAMTMIATIVIRLLLQLIFGAQMGLGI